jgi:hypothetical protein
MDKNASASFLSCRRPRVLVRRCAHTAEESTSPEVDVRVVVGEPVGSCFCVREHERGLLPEPGDHLALKSSHGRVFVMSRRAASASSRRTTSCVTPYQNGCSPSSAADSPGKEKRSSYFAMPPSSRSSAFIIGAKPEPFIVLAQAAGERAELLTGARGLRAI